MKKILRFIGVALLLISIFCGFLVAIYSFEYLKNQFLEWWKIALINLSLLFGGGFIAIIGLLFIYLGVSEKDI